MKDPFEIVGRTVDDAVTIDALVGEGGFGVVYRGHHIKLREPVALKVLKMPASLDEAQRETFLKKFQLEARILYRLSQETLSVVRALGFGSLETNNGWAPYCLLEWLDGQSLDRVLLERRERIKKGELAPGRKLSDLTPMLDLLMEAVDKAHGIGVIHRDIKPANVFVNGSDERPTVKLLDFGIAKLVDLGSDLAGTTTLASGTLMALTPEYAAPEQWDRDLGAVSAKTDIYALALLLLELMLDRHPHDGASASQRMFSACNPAKRPTPRRLGLSVSDEVERCFSRALAVHPDDRPASAMAFWRELRAAALADPSPPAALACHVAVKVVDAGDGASPLGATQPVVTGADAGRRAPARDQGVPATAPAAAYAPTAASQPDVSSAPADDDVPFADSVPGVSAATVLSPGVAPPRAGRRRRMLLLGNIAVALIAVVGVSYVAFERRGSDAPVGSVGVGLGGEVNQKERPTAHGDTPKQPLTGKRAVGKDDDEPPKLGETPTPTPPNPYGGKTVGRRHPPPSRQKATRRHHAAVRRARKAILARCFKKPPALAVVTLAIVLDLHKSGRPRAIKGITTKPKVSARLAQCVRAAAQTTRWPAAERQRTLRFVVRYRNPAAGSQD